jgi:hypothetical protein
MVVTVRLKDAESMFPKYDDYPNISVTGSLIGMRDIYGWNLYYVVRIGGYYYYLKGHPDVDKIKDLAEAQGKPLLARHLGLSSTPSAATVESFKKLIEKK